MLPDVTFHCIDPDLSVLRLWEDEFPDVKNLRYYFTPTWFGKVESVEPNIWKGGVAECWQLLKQGIKPNDWVIVEMLDSLWELAQSGFVAEIFNKGIGEYFMEARKEMQESSSSRLETFRGADGWIVIKKNHNDDVINDICYRSLVNVYMTTTYKIVTEKAAAKESADMFYQNLGDQQLLFFLYLVSMAIFSPFTG